jgi:predicted transcriptional regulator
MSSSIRAKVMKEILTDLRAGQSTADALSETLGRSPTIIRSALGSLMELGEITSARICDRTLTVYRLAPASP